MIVTIFRKRGDQFMEKTRTVCIIGAGVAGLAAIKHSLEEGLAPICFEKDSDLGGLWNYHDAPKNGDPSLYKSCCINTSKAMTCYSDFPIPKEFPNFMHHRFFKKYLNLYAQKFSLRDHIHFGHCIMKVKKADDFPDSGDWMVTVRNLRTDNVDTRRVNYVIVANGHLYRPNIPKCPGLDKFAGKVIHTHDYKDFQGFIGKRVLVVGVGNSACDVACEVSRHAEHVSEQSSIKIHSEILILFT